VSTVERTILVGRDTPPRSALAAVVAPIVQAAQEAIRPAIRQAVRPLLIAARKAARRLYWLELLARRRRRGAELAGQTKRTRPDNHRTVRPLCVRRPVLSRAPPAMAPLQSVVSTTGPPCPAHAGRA
jgi:hypothetical protein